MTIDFPSIEATAILEEGSEDEDTIDVTIRFNYPAPTNIGMYLTDLIVAGPQVQPAPLPYPSGVIPNAYYLNGHLSPDGSGHTSRTSSARSPKSSNSIHQGPNGVSEHSTDLNLFEPERTVTHTRATDTPQETAGNAQTPDVVFIGVDRIPITICASPDQPMYLFPDYIPPSPMVPVQNTFLPQPEQHAQPEVPDAIAIEDEYDETENPWAKLGTLIDMAVATSLAEEGDKELGYVLDAAKNYEVESREFKDAVTYLEHVDWKERIGVN
ncbi:hypothetical protein ABW19_dt0205441 [Dactylella cylindrospora]|nr:hypothetical protein ABW19_dt0205441 [Dactylella cylindrospora]